MLENQIDLVYSRTLAQLPLLIDAFHLVDVIADTTVFSGRTSTRLPHQVVRYSFRRTQLFS